MVRMAAALLAVALLAATAAAGATRPREAQYGNEAGSIAGEEVELVEAPLEGSGNLAEVVVTALPFTGLPLALAAVGGAGAVAVGIALRRRARKP